MVIAIVWSTLATIRVIVVDSAALCTPNVVVATNTNIIHKYNDEEYHIKQLC